MNPKMTDKDAAIFLDESEKQIQQNLKNSDLPYSRSQSHYYFGFVAARQLFNLRVEPKAIAFQIVKGGTGKTSLAQAFAVRANLYGLRVLCIDLDQQGNLTHTFDVDAESVPVMIDILAEGYSFQSAITRVYPGMDILASRIENALLDDVIKLKKIDLTEVYTNDIAELKKHYDLIVIDCPPNLGQSVAAVTLAVDQVVAPVVPENFALAGLKATYKAIQELEQNYDRGIDFLIALNKYDARTILSQDALHTLLNHPGYKDHLLKSYIPMSQEFPNAIAKGQTIFDIVKPSIAKSGIDAITREILGIGADEADAEQKRAKRFKSRSHRLEESLA